MALPISAGFKTKSPAIPAPASAPRLLPDDRFIQRDRRRIILGKPSNSHPFAARSLPSAGGANKAAPRIPPADQRNARANAPRAFGPRLRSHRAAISPRTAARHKDHRAVASSSAMSATPTFHLNTRNPISAFGPPASAAAGPPAIMPPLPEFEASTDAPSSACFSNALGDFGSSASATGRLRNYRRYVFFSGTAARIFLSQLVQPSLPRGRGGGERTAQTSQLRGHRLQHGRSTHSRSYDNPPQSRRLFLFQTRNRRGFTKAHCPVLIFQRASRFPPAPSRDRAPCARALERPTIPAKLKTKAHNGRCESREDRADQTIHRTRGPSAQLATDDQNSVCASRSTLTPFMATHDKGCHASRRLERQR